MALLRTQSIARHFKNNKDLQQFVLTDVTPTGRILGTGSFGSVEEVVYQQLTCAGKRIHEALLDVENEGVPKVILKYKHECQLMSSLRHPNVTQFLGLCFLPGTQLPLLVMERLETNLDDILEHAQNLPLPLKCSILENVASGLLYLHKRNPPVIHRDLTSRNVLLTTSLMAKITDMGNSRIIKPGQVVKTLTEYPGTLLYMPPEAQDDAHRYGPSLDIFSFGHLALFTITQKSPCNLLASTFLDAGNLQARNEVQRRQKYIEILEALVGRYHPALVELVKECLNNATDRRPTTDDLLARLQRIREEVEEGGGAVRFDMSKMKLLKEVKIKDKQIQELTQRQAMHEAELEQNRRELERKQEEKHEQITQKDQEIARKDQEIDTKHQEIAQYKSRNQQMAEQIVNNDIEIGRKDMELAIKEKEIAQLNDRLQQLQVDIERLQDNFSSSMREVLQSQEAEISSLREELNICQEGAKVPPKHPLQLRWRRGPDMPHELSGYVQSIQVQGTLYVGGGDVNAYTVMAYEISSGKWATLSPYRAKGFAMTAINNHMLLVGGKGHDIDSSKVLGVWSEDDKKWTHPYPDMTAEHYRCSAIGYKQYLVVAGGVGADGRLSSVEIMNTDTKQWYAGPPTPIAWTSMKTAIVGDTCYFMGGAIGFTTKKVYSVSLHALVSQLNSGSSAKDTQIWKELPQLQVKCAAPLSISGCLLAVGGMDSKIVSTIHLYKPDVGQWVKVTDMPTPRYDFTCTAINNNELIVAGGYKNTDMSAQVHLAKIL